MPSFIPHKGPGGKRVWQAHVRRRGYPAQVRTFDTKAEAEAWAGDIESEIRHGTFVSRTEAETTTLREALCRYQAEIVARKRTKGEDAIIRWWADLPLARRPIASVRGKDIAAAIKTLAACARGGPLRAVMARRQPCAIVFLVGISGGLWPLGGPRPVS